MTGVSLSIRNCGASHIEIELDCSDSKNAISNR